MAAALIPGQPPSNILNRCLSAFGCALTVFFGSALLGEVGSAQATPPARSVSSTDDIVAFSSLPREAQQTQQRIYSGGPFPYEKDGTVFGNRERRLARHPRGYYREYTVPTPGVSHRGARRIVCGGSQPTTPDTCFYTEDHYNSFRRIVK